MQKKIKVVFASLLCACVAATLGMTACGEDGVTPKIGDNGNWYIGETDTGVRAEGKQGEQGEPGTPGAQGVGVKNITINAEGKLVITLSNDEVITLGKVVGENGAAGKGVKSFEINGEGKLVVTYSDDTTETLDKVVGNDGRSITGAHVDEEGKLVLEFNEGGNVTAGDVKGVGIKNIEIVEGKFKITMTNDEVIELDIPKSVHTHNWTKGKEVAATCTSIGYTQYTCNVDDCTELKYEFTDATGHTFNLDPDFEIPAATCQDKGLKVFICSECGATKSEATTGEHKYGDGGICEYCKQPRPAIKLEMNAKANEPIDIPADTAQGVHIIEADLGDAKLSTGRLQMYIDSAKMSELVFSESRSQAQHNVYFGYINIEASDSQITFHTTDEAVKADITIKDYEMPTLKADGTSIEVPVNFVGVTKMEQAVYKFKVDSSFSATSYTVNVTMNFKGTMTNLQLFFVDGKTIFIPSSKFSGGSITMTDNQLTGISEYAFLSLGSISSGSDYNFIYPVTISLTKSS